MGAFDACCACGGGSAPTPTPPPAPTPSSTCSDFPSDWADSEGSSCCVYSFSRYCTADGGEGAGWDHDAWGPITDYADDEGISGLDACCACGGGDGASRSVTV